MHVLYVTVGGSPQPVLDAIARWRADRVVFVVSEDDPVSDKPGSWTEVERQTFEYIGPERERKQMPSLVARAALTPGAWEVLKVPADRAQEALDGIVAHANRLPAGAAVTLDYTGGTKSMSAAAYLAAHLLPRARASLVTGPRVDHVRVVDGVQVAQRAAVGRVQEHVLVAICRSAWSRHHYAEAEHALAAMDDLPAPLQGLRVASRALALWDAGIHSDAATALAACQPVVGNDQRQALGRLAGGDTAQWLAWDLYWMAERRGVGGRHDDAVLLLYRLTELVAQWLLRRDHGIDASDVGDRQDVAALVSQARNGRKVLGLVAAWTALAALPGPATASASALGGSLLAFVEFRNHSLYAHGTRPVTRDDAGKARAWVDQHIRPLFCNEGGTALFGQLPTALPAWALR